MLVSLITKNKYQTIQLPEWKDGHFFVTNPDNGEELFDIVGNGDGWLLRACEDNQLLDRIEGPLVDGQLIRVRIGDALEKAILYVEKSGRQYAKFARCLVGDNASFVIGTDQSADIPLRSTVISGKHCVLTCRNRNWSVQALDNRMGVFINGIRTTQANLAFGDVVSVMNQKFIVLPGILALNAQNVVREALHGKLTPIKLAPVSPERILGKKTAPSFFHREPRFTNGVFEKDVNVAAPPSQVQQTARDPLSNQTDSSDALLTYGPAVTSAAAMALGGVANPILGLITLAGSFIFPSLRRKKQQQAEQLKQQEYDKLREEEAKEEAKRRQLYTQYLRKLEQELDALNKKQTQQLLKFNPRPDEEANKLHRDNRAERHRFSGRNALSSAVRLAVLIDLQACQTEVYIGIGRSHIGLRKRHVIKIRNNGSFG